MSDLWILDTHIWIRLIIGDPLLNRSDFQTEIIEKSQKQLLRISEISLWETAMLCEKGRLQLDRPLLDWLKQASLLPGLQTVGISPDIAADSATLPGNFHGDPADRIITSTARVLAGTLITLDEKILAYSSQGWVKALNPIVGE